MRSTFHELERRAKHDLFAHTARASYLGFSSSTTVGILRTIDSP
jgi:hypothetical protein